MGLKGFGGGGGGSNDDAEPAIMAEINITPLTDVFLVLLIIFMVTTSVMSQLGVDVNLPAASESTASNQPEGVIVTLLPDGKVRVNGEKATVEPGPALEERIRAAFTQAKGKLVILEGDREAFLGSAISVMDHARKAGAEKFAIATKPE